LLRYWLTQPQAEEFREMLPELGVNGGLASDCNDCPARGKVFAKPGTVALPDYVNGGLLDNESLGGYLEAEPDKFHVFYLVVNDASTQSIDEVLKVFNDLSDIAAILQQDASHQGEASRGDEQ
jgi:serine-type D-Ala-D-Ala carboxypeptidase/endopeptidase (penicillin-binding protein 4)